MPLKPKSKKRGSKSASFEENFSGTEQDLAKIINNNVKYFTYKQVESDEETVERIAEMFQDCCDTNSLPTVEKLWLCLGVTKETLWRWEKLGIKGAVRSNLIKKAKEIIQGIDAEAVSNGLLDKIAYIFRAKNYYGMTDQVTIETVSESALGDTVDREQLVQRLLKQLGTTAPAASQVQATMTETPSDYDSATMTQRSSDYPAQGQATFSETASDYPENTERLSPEKPSDYKFQPENISPIDVEFSDVDE